MTPPVEPTRMLSNGQHLTLYVLAAICVAAAGVFGWPNRHNPSVALESFVAGMLLLAVFLVAPASGAGAIQAVKDLLAVRRP